MHCYIKIIILSKLKNIVTVIKSGFTPFYIPKFNTLQKLALIRVEVSKIIIYVDYNCLVCFVYKYSNILIKKTITQLIHYYSVRVSNFYNMCNVELMTSNFIWLSIIIVKILKGGGVTLNEPWKNILLLLILLLYIPTGDKTDKDRYSITR